MPLIETIGLFKIGGFSEQVYMKIKYLLNSQFETSQEST